jgi:hypothetical protein
MLPTSATEPDLRRAGGIVRKLSVKSHPDPVLGIAFVCLAHIADKHCGPGFDAAGIELELVYRFQVGSIVLRRQGQSCQQSRHIRIHHSRPALHNDRVDPALNLEKPRIIRLVGVTANAKLEAILVSLETLPAELVPVQLQKGLDELRYRLGFRLGDVIFQFVTTCKSVVL